MMKRALLIGLLEITSCGAAGAMEVGTNFWDVGWGGEPADEAHKYRAFRDYVIKAAQYDPKTGTVKRISEKSAVSR